MKIRSNLVCEEMGNDVVVLDSGLQSVVSVSGVGASVIKRLLAGEPLGEDEPGVAELVAQGILVTEEPNAVSRRTLMVSGAAIGAGGIVALSLPGVAMASSSPGLATPVFTNVPGEDYVSASVSDEGGGDTELQIRRLRIGIDRFDNRDSFPSSALLEWSFTSSGVFREFVAEEGLNRYQWGSNAEPYVEVPFANQLDNDRFTVVLRMRLADQVSATVEVVFLGSD